MTVNQLTRPETGMQYDLGYGETSITPGKFNISLKVLHNLNKLSISPADEICSATKHVQMSTQKLSHYRKIIAW